MNSAFDRLPETITAPRTDAVYNCHAYLTKVPIGAITPFIEAFTNPGDVVCDMFAGSGMTGLAASTVGRQSRLSDISALGQHIATGYMTKAEPEVFRRVANEVMAKARAALGAHYNVERASDQSRVEMVRTVWSFTYQCPACSQELVYYEEMTKQRTAAPDRCRHCEEPFVRRKWARARDVPVEVVVRSPEGRLIAQPVTNLDHQAILAAAGDPRQADVPSLTIDPSREMYSRSGLGKAGLTNTSQFFRLETLSLS